MQEKAILPTQEGLEKPKNIEKKIPTSIESKPQPQSPLLKFVPTLEKNPLFEQRELKK
jgi:hypothetical protein